MELIQHVAAVLNRNISSVIKGKEGEVNKMIMALLCEGHILLEDVPGTGKTTVAKALARSIGGKFKRVQFTPDLLPTDLIGLNIYNQKHEEFVFREGPIFTNILLADEINRATPRTQSSLLECMEETQVSIDGHTYELDKPFLVIATQNTLETQGTFPLPEAQLDRFFLKMSMGYPNKEQEIAILTNQKEKSPLELIGEVISKEELIEAQLLVRQVRVSEVIKAYIVDISNATRHDERIKVGLSMRGSLAMMRGAQAMAAMSGREYVIPDDVKSVILDIGSHRIVAKNYRPFSESNQTRGLLQYIVEQVTVPTEAF